MSDLVILEGLEVVEETPRAVLIGRPGDADGRMWLNQDACAWESAGGGLCRVLTTHDLAAQRGLVS